MGQTCVGLGIIPDMSPFTRIYCTSVRLERSSNWHRYKFAFALQKLMKVALLNCTGFVAYQTNHHCLVLRPACNVFLLVDLHRANVRSAGKRQNISIFLFNIRNKSKQFSKYPLRWSLDRQWSDRQLQLVPIGFATQSTRSLACNPLSNRLSGSIWPARKCAKV